VASFRTYKNTELTVSEVGLRFVDDFHRLVGILRRAKQSSLMHKAFDLGITLFDAADTYGNGLSEELIAKAFRTSGMRL